MDYISINELLLPQFIILKDDTFHVINQPSIRRENFAELNSNEPIITFIIPSIGRNTLPKTIESLQAMHDTNWKAIIVFDGIDPTVSYTDPRIQVIRIEKTGEGPNHAGRVRNAGIKIATTPWIGLVDDDDTLEPTYVTYMKSHLMEHSPDVIIFRMMYDNGGILPPPGATSFEIGKVGISFCFKTELCTESCFVPSGVEDFILLNTFRNQSKRIFISPHVTYHVRS